MMAGKSSRVHWCFAVVFVCGIYYCVFFVFVVVLVLVFLVGLVGVFAIGYFWFCLFVGFLWQFCYFFVGGGFVFFCFVLAWFGFFVLLGCCCLFFW